MANSQNVVGAHILCFVNGSLFAEVVGLHIESATPRIARPGVDSVVAYGLDPGPARVRATVSCLRRHNSGGLEGQGLTATYKDLPREKYFSVLLINRATGAKLLRADYCLVTNQAWSFAAKERVTGTFGFEGLTWSTEVEA